MTFTIYQTATTNSSFKYNVQLKSNILLDNKANYKMDSGIYLLVETSEDYAKKC